VVDDFAALGKRSLACRLPFLAEVKGTCVPFGYRTGLPHQNPDDDNTNMNSIQRSTRIGKASIPFEPP